MNNMGEPPTPEGKNKNFTPNFINASPFPSTPTLANYQKVPISKQTYLAYVVVIRDSLNFHLDIYWPEKIKQKYESVINYTYDFRSEELGSGVFSRQAYSCHLKGVELMCNEDEYCAAKEAHSFMTKKLAKTNGWVLVSVSDIDVYRRILVTLFDVVTRQNINDELLAKKNSKTGTPLAKEYIRPSRIKATFTPISEKKDYRIVYNGDH